MTSTIRMERCPKFHGCNAPLCPLDPDWRKRSIIQGENQCHSLCEASKTGAEERFDRRYDEDIFIQASESSEEMRRYSKALNRGLQRASNTLSVVPMIHLELNLDCQKAYFKSIYLGNHSKGMLKYSLILLTHIDTIQNSPYEHLRYWLVSSIYA